MKRRFEGESAEAAVAAAEAALGRPLGDDEKRAQEREGKLVVEVEVAPPAGIEPEAARLAEDLFKGIGLELRQTVSGDANGLRIVLEGADTERLTDHHGELLGASQYLIQKVLSRRHGDALDASYRIEVDAGGYRERRQEELTRLAERTAEAVRRTGKKALLPPLTPSERRLIHLALAESDDVATESEGDGLRKRVAIFPKPKS